MITRVTITQLFENMEEATIGAWLVKQGDAVAVGDALCDLITEKTTLQLEAETAGTVALLIIPDKSVVPVGTVVALLAQPGDDVQQAAAAVGAENAALHQRRNAATAAPTASVAAIAPAAKPAMQAATPAAAAGSRTRATPAARRLARELGVDLESVASRQPGKVVTEDDIRNA